MGDRTAVRRPLAWQSTLAEMKRHGTRVARSCTNARCGCWLPLGVEALIAKHGADFMLWDRRDPCHACGRPAHYMASTAPATPLRPPRNGPKAEMARKAWLRSFGFTRRDRLRIQRLAEQVTEHHAPLQVHRRYSGGLIEGYVRDWFARNEWPDCCGEPNLPFDCRKEAKRAADMAPAVR
jgi:hypothetical protein